MHPIQRLLLAQLQRGWDDLQDLAPNVEGRGPHERDGPTQNLMGIVEAAEPRGCARTLANLFALPPHCSVRGRRPQLWFQEAPLRKQHAICKPLGDTCATNTDCYPGACSQTTMKCGIAVG